ncbi:MAG: DUF6468 domain-containing protein [Pseudomonadota bacterium]
MELIVDFMLLAASAAATFYCIILSRRLERLNDTKDGLGATIASMSEMVEQARTAVTLARQSSAESIEALSPLVEETRSVIPKLEELIEVVSDLADIAIDDIMDTKDLSVQELRHLIVQSQKAAHALRQITTETRKRVENKKKKNSVGPLEPIEDVTYIDDFDIPVDDRNFETHRSTPNKAAMSQ